jgi:hypothetical protein
MLRSEWSLDNNHQQAGDLKCATLPRHEVVWVRVGSCVSAVSAVGKWQSRAADPDGAAKSDLRNIVHSASLHSYI